MDPRVDMTIPCELVGDFTDECDLPPEYAHLKDRLGRTVSEYPVDRAVILDPDVKAVFQTSAQVNAALRAILNAVPKPRAVPQAEAV